MTKMNEPTDRAKAVPPGLLAAMLDDQRRSWQQGERVLVESFLKRVPELQDDHAGLLDLIYSEIVLREHAGEHPAPEEYLARFPQLRDELTLQFEVDRALNLELLTAPPDAAPPAAAAVPARDLFAETPFPALPGYEILGILGHGPRGVVYKARHLESGRLCALKIVLAGFNSSPIWLRNFRAEADAWMRFKNRHIIAIDAIAVHEGRLVVCMELLERSLAARVAGNDPVPAKQAAQWLQRLAQTIHEVHQRGLAHRNLKTTNIFLGPDDALKMADFGMLSSAALGEAAPGWLPEEPAQKDALPRGADEDVTALGSIFYELLTGRPPGAIDRPPPLLARDLAAICHSCLHANPRRRYASAAALAADLNAYLAGKRVRAGRARFAPRATASFAGRVTAIAWQGIATFALVAVGVSFIWSSELAFALLAVVAFAIGFWWSSVRTRRRLEEMDAQKRLAQERAARLALHFELANRLTRSADNESILPLILETTLWLLNAEQAVVFHVDAERRELWTRTKGTPIRVPLGGGIVGAAAKLAEPIHVTNPAGDSRFERAVDGCLDRAPRNLLALPIFGVNGAVIGVMLLINKRSTHFTEQDIELMRDFLASIAAVVERALTGENALAGRSSDGS
jgi:serine/threonine-protein kinase